MDILEAMKRRKSIREFLDRPVPREVIRELLAVACRAPSAMNTQPWEFTVVAGDVLDSIRRALVEHVQTGDQPHPEHAVVGWPVESVYRRRQVDLAKRLFQLMDIRREDAEKRTAWRERGFRFFNAPVAIIISVDRMLAAGTPIFDIGAVTQNVCLAALHYGLGTCIEDQGVMYPEVLRRYCGISETKQIVIAVAVGYPNWEYPANRLESPREPVDSLTTWCGFTEGEPEGML